MEHGGPDEQLGVFLADANYVLLVIFCGKSSSGALEAALSLFLSG